VNSDLEAPLPNAETEETFLSVNSRPEGGQAEYLRVPNALTNLIVVKGGKEKELDYLTLADIWPTAWWALDRAEMEYGDTVVVFGAGAYRSI
jgi:threonine dehydrogenase-like Zn-dependent dehydrogenase